MLNFPILPAEWRDQGLAERWVDIRRARKAVNEGLESKRRDGVFGSSLQAGVALGIPAGGALGALSVEDWAETLIVSQVALSEGGEASLDITLAPGAKCERCWRVLPEVGASAAHPGLCLRCEAVVEG